MVKKSLHFLRPIDLFLPVYKKLFSSCIQQRRVKVYFFSQALPPERRVVCLAALNALIRLRREERKKKVWVISSFSTQPVYVVGLTSF